MKKILRNFCFMLAVILFISLFPAGAYAAGAIAADTDSSLLIQYKFEGTPLPGAFFKLYRIASVDSDDRFTLTETFSGYGIRVNSNSPEQWNEIADTLAAYVTANNETPDYSGYTDGNGELNFSALETGLYLVVGDKTQIDPYTYTAKPALISLPTYNAEEDDWNYDVTVSPKVQRDKTQTEPETVRREVHKIWDDGGNRSNRPEFVLVQLYADGKPYGEPVKLSKDNNWSYIWGALPLCDDSGSRIVWTVTEQKVDGYTVTLSQTGITFTITNTADQTPPPSPTPTPTPAPTHTPGRPGLPQTGMLWYPVPILLIAGILLICIGIGSRRRDEE